MPLSEKVRIEVFIPDSPKSAYRDLLEELAVEFSQIPENITPLMVSLFPTKSAYSFLMRRFRGRDRLALEQYVEWVRRAAERALDREEVILVSLYPVYHGE